MVGKTGGGPAVNINSDGEIEISFNTLKPTGAGNTKLMFGDLAGKATIASFLSPAFLAYFAHSRGWKEAP